VTEIHRSSRITGVIGILCLSGFWFAVLCDRRRRWLVSTVANHTFERALERIRRGFSLTVYGYVIMPEHVHLLLSEPQTGTLAEAIK